MALIVLIARMALGRRHVDKQMDEGGMAACCFGPSVEGARLLTTGNGMAQRLHALDHVHMQSVS